MMTFEEWKSKLDELLIEKEGMGLEDMDEDDMGPLLKKWFEQGDSPEDIVEDCFVGPQKYDYEF
jgi:hypothetical protein